MDGHPSAQARALVTLGNSGRFFLGAFFENLFSPKGAQKNSPKWGEWGGLRSLGLYIYIYIYIFPIIYIYIYIYIYFLLANWLIPSLLTLEPDLIQPTLLYLCSYYYFTQCFRFRVILCSHVLNISGFLHCKDVGVRGSQYYKSCDKSGNQIINTPTWD